MMRITTMTICAATLALAFGSAGCGGSVTPAAPTPGQQGSTNPSTNAGGSSASGSIAGGNVAGAPGTASGVPEASGSVLPSGVIDSGNGSGAPAASGTVSASGTVATSPPCQGCSGTVAVTPVSPPPSSGSVNPGGPNMPAPPPTPVPPACNFPLPDICEACSNGETVCAHYAIVNGQCVTEICPPGSPPAPVADASPPPAPGCATGAPCVPGSGCGTAVPVGSNACPVACTCDGTGHYQCESDCAEASLPPPVTESSCLSRPVPQICELCPSGIAACAHWVYENGMCELELCPGGDSD